MHLLVTCLMLKTLVRLVCVSRYLHSTGHQYGRPIAGQKEISGYKYATDDNLWKAMEGVYLKADAKAV